MAIKLIEHKLNKKVVTESVDNPLVIYKDLQGYAVTPKYNYTARVSNARKIHHLPDFDSAQEVIDYYVKYGWANAEDFEVIDESNAKESIEVKESVEYNPSEHEDKYNYMFLDRLLSDVKYYLGNGDRYPGTLWAHDVDDHIDLMYKIWDYLAKDGVEPEWLSREDIDTYAQKMGYHQTDKSQLEESIWGDYKPYDKTEGWTDEDIELHKSIDWAARDYKEYPVIDDSFNGKAVCYSTEDGTVYQDCKFIKYIRSNPIYPPYYAPEENPFPNAVGPMYDGNHYGNYDIHDRYESQEIYDALSK